MMWPHAMNAPIALTVAVLAISSLLLAFGAQPFSDSWLDVLIFFPAFILLLYDSWANLITVEPHILVVAWAWATIVLIWLAALIVLAIRRGVEDFRLARNEAGQAALSAERSSSP
jgi:hypothetical protein